MSYKLTVTPSVRVAKRAIDLASSIAGLALTLPLYPAIAAAIYLESPGPIFYKQRRAGMLKGVHPLFGDDMAGWALIVSAVAALLTGAFPLALRRLAEREGA